MTPIEAGSVNVPINTTHNEQGSGSSIPSLLILGLFGITVYLLVTQTKIRSKYVQK
jgi:hypothetical protein